MKPFFKLKKPIFMAFAFLLSFGMAHSQNSGCEMSLEAAPITSSATLLATPNPGSFDLAIDFDYLSCSDVSGDLCLCECYLAIYFAPLEPTYLSNYPEGPQVNGLSLEVDQQILVNMSSSQSLGYYANANVLVIALGSQTNVSSGTLLLDLDQPLPPSTTISIVSGLCVIDNIDKPISPDRNNAVLHHLGLNDPDLYVAPR